MGRKKGQRAIHLGFDIGLMLKPKNIFKFQCTCWISWPSMVRCTAHSESETISFQDGQIVHVDSCCTFWIHGDWIVIFMPLALFVFCETPPVHVATWSRQMYCLSLNHRFFGSMLALLEQPSPQFTRYVSAWLQETKKRVSQFGCKHVLYSSGNLCGSHIIQSWNWTEKLYQTLANISFITFLCSVVSLPAVCEIAQGGRKTFQILNLLATCVFLTSKFECCKDSCLFTRSGMASGGRIGVGWRPCLARLLEQKLEGLLSEFHTTIHPRWVEMMAKKHAKM